MVENRHRNLPRLEKEYYRGKTAVHWTSCTVNRKQGWLKPEFHHQFREVLVHACLRYSCVVPVYCLMPDHSHVLFQGVQDDADLYLANKFLRMHTAKALLPARYQPQAYDHVLRDDEMVRNAFEGVAWYIIENPVRAGLCAHVEEYPYSGCVVPGYPDMEIHHKDFWERFWRICERIAHPPPSHDGGYG
jgi:REP element-mobilizing transposase RayT